MSEAGASESGRAAQDRADLQRELIGEENGRVKRFLPENASPATLEKKREEDRQRQFALQQLMLEQEAAFQKLYNDTFNMARRAGVLTAEALENLDQLLMRQQEALELSRDNATRLYDGRLVFQDAQGRARFEDGSAVDAEDAATIVWRENAPSYEAHRSKHDAVTDTTEKIQEYKEYELTVGDIQNRLEDGKDTLTPDEVKAMQEELIESAPEEIQPQLLNIEATHVPTPDSHSFKVAVPKL